MSKEVPARISVIPSPKSSRAIILRRGPTRHVAVIGWDRETDEIKLGQWLKGTIYPAQSDLSPDGEHFVYFAGNAKLSNESGGWWTAVSKYPYLHATHFAGQSGTHYEGGAFLPDGTLFLNGVGGMEIREYLNEVVYSGKQSVFPSSTDGFWMGDLYATRMSHQGWGSFGTGYDVVLHKKFKSWTLSQRFFGFDENPKNRGSVIGEYSLYEFDTGKHVAFESWDWADVWNGQLRFSEKGRLYKAKPCEEMGFKEVELIYDFNPMVFEAIRAPYDTRSNKRVWP
jgi:hypothetical protein